MVLCFLVFGGFVFLGFWWFWWVRVFWFLVVFENSLVDESGSRVRVVVGGFVILGFWWYQG